MEASINYLSNIISEEIRHSEEVLNLLYEKEKILISNNITALKKILMKEHSLFVKSRELETSRISVLEIITTKLGIPIKQVTLKILAEKLSGQYSMRMSELRSRLFDILKKIQRQNEKCELLLRKSIEIINFSLNLISGTKVNKLKMVYDKNCRTDSKFNSEHLLDKKV